MARIYPERPPQSIIDDPKHSAEMKVFHALQTLPDRYVIFYSMHWQNFHDDWGVQEGEADFIIVHPDMGILVLEVKGGAVIYKSDQGKWFSQDRNGNNFEIKDPVEQGRKNHYEIRNKLENLPNWPQSKLNIWHAVCFPHIYLKNQSLKPDLPREAIIDADDLNDITTAVKRVFSHCFGQNIVTGVPGQDRMKMIEGLLASSFEIRSPLGIELEREDEKLIELTEQQFRALSILGDRKKAAIAGCAGSGKTMLAARKAQQFTELGMSVLLVCFNIALAEDLRKRLPTIEVYNFHKLCREAASQAGISIGDSIDEKDLYDNVLPEALLDAAEKLGRVYDAIIIDEGQDFQENYWIALESLLKEDGYLYIFYDDNQNLYGGIGNFGGLILEPPFVLNQNCRNTKAIHHMIAQYHNNPDSLLCFGPEGRPPELIQYSGEDDQIRQLQKVLYNLIVEEHVDNQDIVVLTPRGENNTRLVPGLKLGIFTITDQPANHESKIQATSIYKFKGLERRVVIITEIDKHTLYNRDMVMYVGCSRARTQLIILSDENASRQIKDREKTET
jgi:thymidine kinase